MPDLDIGLLLIIAACVISGFLIGAALATLLSRRRKPSAPPAQAVQPLAASAQAEEPALARLWRGATPAELRVEMRGRTYDRAAQLDAGQRAEMVELLRHWVAWLGYQPAAPAPKPAPAPAAAPRTAAPVPAPDKTEEIKVEKKAPPSARSMVEQVDEILHEMQAGLPANVTRIRLMDDQQHGILVWIGLQQYRGIENIPDENARRLVQQAVAEWEHRHG